MNRVLTDEQVQRLAVYLNEHADRLMPRDRLNRMDYTIVGMADGYRMVKGWLFRANVKESTVIGEWNFGELRDYCESKIPFESQNDEIADYRFGFINGYKEALHFVEWSIQTMGHENDD